MIYFLELNQYKNLNTNNMFQHIYNLIFFFTNKK